MEKTFTKRSGTTDKGKDYEDYNIANMAMRLISNEKITDFYISSNDNNFGEFGDIVVQTQMENDTEIYALQLKHSERGNLSLKQLTQASGNFGIKKYFDSVQTMKTSNAKFILYTNLKLTVKEGAKFRLDGQDFSITLTKIYPNHTLEISQKSNYCYKFSIVKDSGYEDSDKLSFYEEFFDFFFLYSDQDGVNNLKLNVIKDFQTLFCGNEMECDQYVKVFNEWTLQEDTKEKLNKKWVKQAIALKIFSSRIKSLSFDHDDGVETGEFDRRNILREAIACFDVTVFRKTSYDEVKTFWNDTKSELVDLKFINKLRTKYQLGSGYISDINKVDSLTLSILLWLMRKCPLILAQDANIHKSLELCAGEKFILIKDDCEDLIGKKFSVFETLSDLTTRTSKYKKLVQNFTVSLQGKQQMCIENVVKSNHEILNVFKTDDLLEMYKIQCCIGEPQENLPEPYIERSLLKNAIKIEIIDNLSEESVVILDCVSPNKDLQDKLKHHNLIHIDDCLNIKKDQTTPLNIAYSFSQRSHIEVATLKTVTIYLSTNRCNYSEFHEICNKTKNFDNVHQFRVRDDGNFEWIRSKGDVNDIERYKLSECYSIQEYNLDSSQFENNINLLIGDSGMGKSVLMKRFKIKCFPEYFTVIIDPKDVYSFFKNTHSNDVDAFQTFLLNEQYNMLSGRDKDIFSIFLKNNQIVYVWDALDELSDEHRDIVNDIIVELSENCVQWVTSRGHLQIMLQRKFNVISLNLSKFDEEEQNNYILERLAKVSLKEAIEKIIEKIKSSFALVEHKDILGIPLQIFMLTELFPHDQEKYLALLDNFFTLTDLYKYFIEEKMNIHCSEKLGIGLNTAYAEFFVESQKEKMLEEYTNAALTLLLPDTIFRQLNVEYIQNSQLIHEGFQNIGLISEIKDQIPRFLHNSFAEYLVARYFANNLQHKEILVQVIFDPKHINVRFFFDLLLAGDSEPHVAILYKNFDFIKHCENRILIKTDVGGRTVSHLACSWGQRYPEFNVKYLGDTYVIQDQGKFVFVPDTKEYLETIDCLQEKYDFSEPDVIFKMTPREYARQATCMGAEMRIMMKENILKSIQIDHIINILYYSVIYGYSKEFEFFLGSISKIESMSLSTKRRYKAAANAKNMTGMSLLYIAASMGHINIVQLLDKAGAHINLASEDDVTPLCVASYNGHDKVAEFLAEAGADMNLANKDGFTPLYLASQKGYDKIVEFLVKAGADTNLANKEDYTPLCVASHKGYGKIVEFLVQADADINLANNDGITPLYLASLNGHDKIVEFLVKTGADVNLANRDSYTPLSVACRNEHDQIFEFLIKEGANINLADKVGVTPISIASFNGHEKIIELLVKAGADVNLADNRCFTPLIVASYNGNDTIVELLVKEGANINLAEKNGLTPLCVASRDGHEKLVQTLIKADVNINLANKVGSTALYLASRNGHDNVVEFLVNGGCQC